MLGPLNATGVNVVRPTVCAAQPPAENGVLDVRTVYVPAAGAPLNAKANPPPLNVTGPFTLSMLFELLPKSAKTLPLLSVSPPARLTVPTLVTLPPPTFSTAASYQTADRPGSTQQAVGRGGAG